MFHFFNPTAFSCTPSHLADPPFSHYSIPSIASLFSSPPSISYSYSLTPISHLSLPHLLPLLLLLILHLSIFFMSTPLSLMLLITPPSLSFPTSLTSAYTFS